MDAPLIQELAPMLYTFKDTEFEIKNTDIINTWVEKSYLPFIYNWQNYGHGSWQRNLALL